MSWGKEIKCEACQAFYLFFRNKFNKFNNTGAWILDSIYQMTLKFIKNIFLAWKHHYLDFFYTTI